MEVLLFCVARILQKPVRYEKKKLFLKDPLPTFQYPLMAERCNDLWFHAQPLMNMLVFRGVLSGDGDSRST